MSNNLGLKRLIYEELAVDEYWVVNGHNSDAIAF
ncbi:MAG: Uma2 family endonuclease [Trichodesmium sp. MAG_R01]|nr:Uma2 family endonuclease [Trichodesmium sp. MAG_R01]